METKVQEKALVDSNGWVHCPICKGKSRTKVMENTELKNFPLFCPKCGHTTIIDLPLEPDAKTQSRIL